MSQVHEINSIFSIQYRVQCTGSDKTEQVTMLEIHKIFFIAVIRIYICFEVKN